MYQKCYLMIDNFGIDLPLKGDYGLLFYHDPRHTLLVRRHASSDR